MSENLPKKRNVRSDKTTIDGRDFIYKKFNPMLGNYILVKIISMVLPFGIGKEIGDGLGVETGKSGIEINKKDFIDLQSDILQHCYEVLPGNTTPVVRENGTFGINDASSLLCIKLIIGCVIYNFQDFFDGDLLASLVGNLPVFN